MSPRELALDLVIEWQKSSSLADDLFEQRLGPSRLSPFDTGLARELFYGWLRQRLYLEAALDGFIARPPRREIQVILELAAFQVLCLDRIPPHAAVNEAVALAKTRTTPAEGKFVNAVLRRFLLNRPAIVEKLSEIQQREPWTFFSHPRWLWDRWQERWGPDPAAAICDWNNQPPPVYVRRNTLKMVEDPKETARGDARPPTSGSSESFGGRASPRAESSSSAQLHPLCRRVDDPAGLFGSDAWKQGAFYVQDPSTLLAVDLLDPQPGDDVLDVCAAPGGKTTYIAQKMRNRGKIIAADSSNHRLGRVGDNCRRLGVKIVAALPCEGTRLDRCLRGSQFDRVLVDAPCSNTGVMRRRPDLRWRLNPQEIERLAGLQLRLLTSAAAFVRPGGRLVYSTCSVEREENEGVVDVFVARNSGFSLETTRALFPPDDNMDGAFVAVFGRAR